MSLFDDLLSKTPPTPKTDDSSGSTSSSGGSTQQDPVIIMSESESIGTEEIILNTPEVPTIVNSAPLIITPVETDNSIILGSTSNFGESPVIINSPSDTTIVPSVNDQAEEKRESVTGVSSAKMENNNSPLFNMITQLESSKIPESTQINTNIIPEATAVEMKFNDTAEYINHAIGEVEILMKNIETTDAAKIEERDRYEKEKEKFAELEKNAEKEHQNMLKEKAHAMEVRAYLENEITGKMNTKHEKIKTKTSAANDDTFELAA